MSTDIIEKIKEWIHSITVEPTMFLYMFAFMFTTVVEQAFFVRKACLVNHNYTVEICDNIKDYENITKEVQVTTSNFHQLDSIAGHIFPIILALFLGAWSDKRGRKLPLLFGLFGKLIYSLMIIVNDNQPTWPLEYVIFTATMPCAFTGADLAIFASCFAYLTDVSTSENRTIRVTILEVVYLVTVPTGVALGSYMFNNVLNKSYTWMFSINASLLIVSIIYTFVALKWQTNPRQRPYSELNACGFLPDFFDKQHVFDSIKVLTKHRTQNRRSFLIIIMITMGLYTFVRDEKAYLFLYTQFKFKWGVQQFSNFKTFQSSAYVVVLLIAVPIMNKVLKWRDTVIILFGCTFYAMARLIYFFANVPYVFYLGGIVCAFGPIAGPGIRAFTSKLVPIRERGKVFALLSVCDNAIPFISGVLYTQVYNATVGRMGGIFLLSFSCLVLAICLMTIVQCRLGNKNIVVTEEDPPTDDKDSVSNIIVENETEKDIQNRKI
ncbi:solute carrier family 46 member 3-like [Condylostylus longicornis]|uniref:solute carrier family 46 member 3-like n=1 Tax=Condylostylus longicornis TaxID=2530218 RepID=UPI00244E1978|nr:solute carrier family 46 member 3-like [Condylostylus longicornis]